MGGSSRVLTDSINISETMEGAAIPVGQAKDKIPNQADAFNGNRVIA